MTCGRLRRYFEDSLGLNAGAQAIPAEIVDHLKSCRTCTQLVEARMQLGTDLRLLRNSVPLIAASLDAAAIADYRRWVSQQRSLDKSAPPRKKIRPLAALAWAAAVTLAILVAYGAASFFGRLERERAWIEQRSAAPKPIQALAKVEDNPKLEKSLPNTAKERPNGRKRSRVSATTARDRGSSPPNFRTLMYCDQLSCSGDMQVIRVQVPSRALGLLSALTQGNDVISADVLVGSDGIARGIRIAE